GCRVVTDVEFYGQTRDGADQNDDATMVLLEHRGHGRLDRLPHPGQIDVDLILELLLGDVPQRCRVVQRACVGDHDVKPPQLRDSLRDSSFTAPEIPDVNLVGEDAAAAALDQIDRRDEVVGVGHGVGNRVDLAAE